MASPSLAGGSTPRAMKSYYPWLALSCTSLGTLMATLNAGTLIIALPVLLRELHTDLFTLVWVLLAYLLAQTVLVLTAGRLADMVGRKTLYVIGFAAFGVAALVAGFCTTGLELIIVRAFQGAAGAFMLANSSALVTDAFPKKQLGMALGTNMIVAAVGSILGTILGGWLTGFGWQWVFWFNVPFSVIGTIWAIVNLRELAQIESKQRFDVVGTLSFIVAMVGLLIGLSAGGIQGWTAPIVIGGFVAAVVAFPIFTVAEIRARQPMIDLRLFTHRPFTIGNLSSLFNAMARQGVTFLFVFYFQGPKGDDPITAGLLLTPIAAAMLLVSPFSGYLADRFGSRWLSVIGLALTTVGLAGMAFIDLNTSYWYIVAVMAVMGAGSGFFNSPNSRLIMTSVRPGQRGLAAGSRTMLTNSGGVISIALTLAIVVSAIPASVLFAIFAGVTSGLPTSSLVAFVDGLHTAFWVMTGISVVSLLIAFLPYKEGVFAGQASTQADVAALGQEESGLEPALAITEPASELFPRQPVANGAALSPASFVSNEQRIGFPNDLTGSGANGNGHHVVGIERAERDGVGPLASAVTVTRAAALPETAWLARYEAAQQDLENAVTSFLIAHPEYLPPGQQSISRFTLHLLDRRQFHEIEAAMRDVEERGG
jgi:EmrB/QacA subfamily drug resistance transporter